MPEGPKRTALLALTDAESMPATMTVLQVSVDPAERLAALELRS